MSEISESIEAKFSPGLKGEISVSGDKSISHRALILGGLTIGETFINGILESEDVLKTASAMSALGAKVIQNKSSFWSIKGVGVGGFAGVGA